MRQVFLGKPVHWVLVFVMIAIGWAIGHERMHVTWFNLFTIILLVVSAAAVVVVLKTTRSDEQVTRDPLESDD